MRACSTFLALAFIAAGGCSGCDGGAGDDDPDAGDVLARETWAVQCQNRFPIAGVVPLGANEADFYVRLLNDEESPVVGGTTRGGITRDGGSTVSLVPLEVDVGTGQLAERRANILGAVPEIVGVGPHFFSSMRPRNEAGSNSTGYPAHRVIVVDGEGKEVAATSGSAAGVPPLPDGVAADQAWQWDAQRWVARRGFRMFATEDGGASWHVTGPAFEVRVAGRRLVSRGTLGARVLVQDMTDPAIAGPYYLVADDGTQTEVPVTGAVGNTNPALLLDANLRPWGERLVHLHRGDFWVSDDLGATWTPLVNAETTPETAHEFDAAVDAAGNLYVFPDDDGDGDLVIYRYAPGNPEPTVIELDFEGLDMRHLVDLGALAGGRLRFVAHPRPTRETYAWFLCTAAAGGEQAIEHAAVESLEAALTSGRVVRLQRFKEQSLHTDRMALSAYGRPYVTSFQHLLTLPLDAPYFYDGRIPSTGLGVLPGALVPFASGWQFQAYLWNLGTETADVIFDARTGMVLAQTSYLTDRVYAVGGSPGPALLRTESGTYASSATIRIAGDPPVPRWGNQVVMDRQNGAVLSNVAYDRFFDLLEPAYLVRFDPNADPVPSLSTCYPEPPGVPPAACDPVPPMSVIAATFDADGNLYALDMRRGRVMMLPAGASGEAAWRTVGAGFSSPSDLQVVPYAGGWMAVVYDGDVWAFAIDPAAPKIRGAGAPERRDAPVVAARDAHDCTADGPCVDDTAPFVDLFTTGAACLAGRGLGGTTGAVLGGATPLEITSWSDAQVCVRAPAGLRDGQLQVIRADGVASNRLPFQAASSFTQWDLPAEVYPDTPLRARGHNLQRGGDHAVVAWALEAGQREVSVGRTTPTTTTVTVRPRVRHGCRVGRREACTIYGA
ncbi:MAG: hypothetical protein K8M05_30905, partial [Deltaproteobacteria bacterium]|nr:hypothetical protein [Kofleriaceae bacterium]